MKTHRLDIPVTVVFFGVLIFIVVVLIRLIENAPQQPVIGVIAALALVGLVCFLADLSLKS